jgi:TonB family protein
MIPNVCQVLHSRFMAERNRFRSAVRFVTLILLTLVGASYSHPQEAPSVTLPDSEIRALASRILRGAGKADCDPGSCIILVQNFKLPSGVTSQLGMRLADEVAKQLAAQQTDIKIIEPSRLRAYLELERIPDTLLNNEKAFRWLGKQLGATVVLNGTTEVRGEAVSVEVSLFSCEKEKAGPQERFSLSSSDFASALTPVDSFPKSLPSPKEASIPLVQRAGVNGITSPICVYCPSPDYNDPAREVKLNGSLLLDVTVSPEGRAIDGKVVRGLPFGLNESAIRKMRDWQFRPATREGQPVACRVQIEVTFRLN